MNEEEYLRIISHFLFPRKTYRTKSRKKNLKDWPLHKGDEIKDEMHALFPKIYGGRVDLQFRLVKA